MTTTRPHPQKILLVGGSVNQSSMVRKIGRHLEEAGYDCWYSPFYCDGILGWAQDRGWLSSVFDRSILGGTFLRDSFQYLKDQGVPVDYKGKKNSYTAVVMATDLLVARNIRDKPYICVQEGMTDPDNIYTAIARFFKLPGWMGGTGMTGLSGLYDIFCVASEGYRDFFASRGVPKEKMVVTGIPNYDNCQVYLDNDFPHRNYIMVATSDSRETFKKDDRRAFLRRCGEIAKGRQLLFKLHPNENFDRSRAEILEIFPQALIYTEGNTSEMIANCHTLITQYSTVVYTGLALEKEVYSAFDVEELKRLTPLQNGGTSAQRIAEITQELL